MKSLANLVPGERGRVKNIEGAARIHQRLAEMGLVPGVSVEMVRVAPLGDPMEIRVQDYRLSLRKADAASVLIEPEISPAGS